MAPVANPARSSKSRSSVDRHQLMYLLSLTAVQTLFQGHDRLNAPDRTRSHASAEATWVTAVASRSSMSFSEYSNYYEHPRAGMRISGAVSEAVPTELEWEIGG